MEYLLFIYDYDNIYTVVKGGFFVRKIGILANIKEFIDKKKSTSALDRVFENIASV